MRAIPVDSSTITLAFIDAVPVDAFDRERNVRLTGQQAADADGVPFWNLNVLCVIEGEDGGETMRVKVATGDKPAFSPLDKVEFEGLTARPWENNGRSGVSFTAARSAPLARPTAGAASR
jgi:hypothetical protein